MTCLQVESTWVRVVIGKQMSTVPCVWRSKLAKEEGLLRQASLCLDSSEAVPTQWHSKGSLERLLCRFGSLRCRWLSYKDTRWYSTWVLESNNLEVDVPENTQDRVLEAALETDWLRQSELGSPATPPRQTSLEPACAGASLDLVPSQAFRFPSPSC